MDVDVVHLHLGAGTEHDVRHRLVDRLRLRLTHTSGSGSAQMLAVVDRMIIIFTVSVQITLLQPPTSTGTQHRATQLHHGIPSLGGVQHVVVGVVWDTFLNSQIHQV